MVNAEAKKEKKRSRNNEVTENIDKDGAAGPSTNEKSKTSGSAPPTKKQKISKKGQENAYRAVYGNEVCTLL